MAPRSTPSAARPSLLQKLDPQTLEHLEFFSSFLKKPAVVGALAPSSPALAAAMLHGCDLANSKAVVEFGPGTGSFTRLILERISRETCFFALELDVNHVERLRKRFPGIKVHNDSASHVRKYLARYNHRYADYIISGLPWANMSAELQERILDKVMSSLSPGGMFTTFTYVHAFWLPGARRFREWLERRFGDIRISRIVWRNTPPALVYRCRL
jgi:phosphatidylethanolamine/phosphatidyl-N-methylethanolamine N-methyltransferase